jgi:transcriptional regulator with XRE-family HTH domain
MQFKYLRKRADLTQCQVAEKLGVDRTTVSKWDIGINLPRAELLPKIALLYGCDVSELLSCDAKEPYAESIQGKEDENNA